MGRSHSCIQFIIEFQFMKTSFFLLQNSWFNMIYWWTAHRLHPIYNWLSITSIANNQMEVSTSIQIPTLFKLLKCFDITMRPSGIFYFYCFFLGDLHHLWSCGSPNPSLQVRMSKRFQAEFPFCWRGKTIAFDTISPSHISQAGLNPAWCDSI